MGNYNQQDDGALNQSASVANTLRGAAKTGKTASNAAKGAAAGPYGALAAGIWENRKLLSMIIAVAAFIMMLPILFIMMLPSLIFGKLGLDKVPDNVMEDDNVIMENISDIEDIIEDILRKSHDKILKEIQNEADELSSDCTYGITDDFADKITFESTLIISQFCASQDDYDEININKLKKLLKNNIDGIFSYHTNITMIEASDEDEDDVTHYEYIVEYKGDQYYADHVFKLDDEQKVIALDYAENLTIYLNDSIDLAENSNILPGETGNAVVDLALTKLGTPYSQEKRNMDGYFDCSSFSYWVYSHFNIFLSYHGANTAASQARYLKERNLVVAYKNLAPGDLVFYSYGVNNRYLNIDHVAIYSGNGYIVESSGSDMKVVYRPIYGIDHIVMCGRPYAEP